jgi:hypothetical protein
LGGGGGFWPCVVGAAADGEILGADGVLGNGCGSGALLPILISFQITCHFAFFGGGAGVGGTFTSFA